ncbi:hypothetical protein BC834DRAFT_970424 [Gloeopeniophorella convolvens]|nr:hypothetical protein BC834DRAFT_970424 [Gloeopeniophorella convolvens]
MSAPDAGTAPDDSDDDDAGLALDLIFTEPPRPPSPPPTSATYTRAVPAPIPSADEWETITVRLVGSHSLWGHHLWNAARSLAAYLEHHPALLAHARVLELGAGGALPALLAAKAGAARVVATDYPDAALLANIAHNAAANGVRAGVLSVVGYVWGADVAPLLEAAGGERFALVLLSDLVFNHSQHGALLRTTRAALAPGGCALVFYTHHRPHLAARDMAFFERAREEGWACEEVVTERFPVRLVARRSDVPGDPGAEEVRATVHGWKLTRDAD